MVKEGNTMYDNATLAKHPLYARWKSTLNDVSNRDYPNTDYFDERIECLDMDAYERRRAKGGNPDMTADAVIGIKTHDGNRSVNPRLLIVELRMGYKSSDTLSVSGLKDKDRHTRELLDGHVTLSPNTIFVFSDKAAGQARSWLARRIREDGSMKYFISWSVADFKRNIVNAEEYPYTPDTDLLTMCSQLDQAYKTNGLIGFIDLVKKKIKWASDTYGYSNINEYEAIKEALSAQVKSTISQHPQLSDDESLRLATLKDDYKFLFS